MLKMGEGCRLGFLLLDIRVRVKFSEVVTMREDKGLIRRKQLEV